MASDLCVLPGHVGLSAIHSLAYGTPILTCNGYDWSSTNKADVRTATSMGHSPEVEAVKEGVTGGFFDDGKLSEKLYEMLYPVPCKSFMEEECKRIVREKYTPSFQNEIIISAIDKVLGCSESRLSD